MEIADTSQFFSFHMVLRRSGHVLYNRNFAVHGAACSRQLHYSYAVNQLFLLRQTDERIKAESANDLTIMMVLTIQ